MDFRTALMDAVKGEQEGRQLYLAIAEKTDDPGAKKVFAAMADEERQHMETLLSMLKDMKGAGGAKPAAMTPLLTAEALSHPIFSPEFKRRIKERHFEVTAISIAMKLEKDAADFYRRTAATAPNAELRSFFEELAAWEARHYDALHREMAELETEYYEKNLFAPY